MTKPYKKDDILKSMHPLVKEWFLSKFKKFAPPQKFAILNVRSRINTLISSPTGSGKTLSAFLSIINELVDLSDKDLLEDKVYCVYISPLKALANDISRNLLEPLKEMEAFAGKELGLRVAIRTGDTSPNEKQKMLRKPPHILITTPESFAIMLTTTKFREKLTDIQWCIVDEIHALANNKRGAHLSLSLERLQQQTNFTRIGLSATVAPLEEVAKFLVGFDVKKNEPRDCKVVDVNFAKQLDLKVLSPVENMMKSTYEEINTATYKLMDQLIQSHRTTLIFTNTRSATERIVHHLKERFPRNYTKIEDYKEGDEDIPRVEEGASSLIGAHHGSLSKEHRLDVETKLKEGKLKAVVSSTSLELGIDIGYIDLVILLGSPKSVARALQRIGRSGHKLHDEAKGRIVVMDRDDLVECSVLLKSALERKIDRIDIPKLCLDVLAQQVLGLALEEPKHVDDVLNVVRGSYNFHELSRKRFKEIIGYLAGDYVSLEDRNVYAKIWFDKETDMIGKKGKMTRVIYMTNIGTIPDETNVKVKVKTQLIGFISEPFLERLKRNDIFILGGNTYQFLFTQGMTAFVKGTVNRPPTVPSWYSEMLPLSYDLALEIQKFRRLMSEHFKYDTNKKDILEFIHSYLHVDEFGANSIYEYMKEQFLFAEIPHDKKIVIEHYTDGNHKKVIFHTLFGRRVNDVLSRAVAFAVSKTIKKDVEMGITDNGFYLSSEKHMQPARALSMVKSNELRRLMTIVLDKTEVLNRRFRHCAARALMILRNYKGRKKSAGRQQRSSRLLLSAVRKISQDFPILEEARREVLEDLMDIQHAQEVIEQIEEGKIKVKEVFTDIPSPFAFNLVLMGHADVMKMEDRLEFLRRMHNMVLAKIEMKQRKNS
ncbi:MAG: ATP-dependent helicase [Nanoarchaeota archaeon]|nr:ATP-dependent helicase [Nanoarchaeota archaeon]MBU1320900.1 ATP-dependent helicase [Nanoarchaeota archaeon]MBU1597576.1 ATP-dependent helicase [Nanoarchaeota archaeon]MBU2441509.1 ATP-dependent helicase [Nanoarchaeota archaeon]